MWSRRMMCIGKCGVLISTQLRKLTRGGRATQHDRAHAFGAYNDSSANFTICANFSVEETCWQVDRVSCSRVNSSASARIVHISADSSSVPASCFLLFHAFHLISILPRRKTHRKKLECLDSTAFASAHPSNKQRCGAPFHWKWPVIQYNIRLTQ